MNVSLLILQKKHVTNISCRQLVILSILFFFISPTEALLLKLDECKTELSEILVVFLKQDYEA